MAQIATTQAPAALGPYSQAIRLQETVYVSGQLGIDPATNSLAEGGIVAETAQALQNLAAILEAAESGLAQVVKTTCYLADLNDFEAFNQTYGEWFQTHPARECVQVAALPKGARVEISAIATLAKEHIL